MSDKQVVIRYRPTPTAELFHKSSAFVRGLRGPIGSGKSVACCLEVWSRCCEQEANAQGIRKSRWAIVRNTRPELEKTTIKTWEDWFPDEICEIVRGAPITGYMRFDLPDGTRVEAEIIFLPLDKPKDVKKLLSLELTGIWFNEAREIPLSLIDGGTGRVGRYPSAKDGVPITWTGVILDTNPPDDDHWWYRLFEQGEWRDTAAQREDGSIVGEWRQFIQPPAMIKDSSTGKYQPNPDAENIGNLPGGFDYYLRQLAGKTDTWIQVYVRGEYGTIQDGKPIYPEYNDYQHLRDTDFTPVTGSTIVLGWDYGLTPACVFMQITPLGHLEIFDELVSERMGIRQFTEYVDSYIASQYPGCRLAEYGDPAGNHASQADDTQTCRTVQAEMGHIVLDGNQDPTARMDAVRWFLTTMVDGVARLRLSPRCKILRKGFNGGYRYRRLQVSYDERYEEKPDKNSYSHPHDALQYPCTMLAQNDVRKAAEERRGTLPTRRRRRVR
jgi:hypothetical protein